MINILDKKLEFPHKKIGNEKIVLPKFQAELIVKIFRPKTSSIKSLRLVNVLGKILIFKIVSGKLNYENPKKGKFYTIFPIDVTAKGKLDCTGQVPMILTIANAWTYEKRTVCKRLTNSDFTTEFLT